MKYITSLHNLLVPHKRNHYKPLAIRHAGLAVAISAIVLSQGVFNLASAHEFRVLGYATNVGSGDLLSLTNANRANSGLKALTLNSTLSQAAQNKANHMIANNYWSHVAPDGTTPWYFFDQAGYSYSRAGENLAYGFTTSSGVVTGWMNSPSHAANILDSSFTEVGFGYANGAAFQGGENTVVVALYAQPTLATPAPVAQTPQPTPVAQVPEQAPVVASASEETTPAETKVVEDQKPAEKPQKEANEAPTANTSEEDTASHRYLARLSEDGTIIVTGSPAPAEPGDTISNFEALIHGDAHWSLYLTMGILCTLGAIYMLRHLQMLYQLAVHGEHYVEGHPMLEASMIYTAIWLLLIAGYGAIL